VFGACCGSSASSRGQKSGLLWGHRRPRTFALPPQCLPGAPCGPRPWPLALNPYQPFLLLFLPLLLLLRLNLHLLLVLQLLLPLVVLVLLVLVLVLLVLVLMPVVLTEVGAGALPQAHQ